MKISVIIPVYNALQYLGQCLDSMLAQSFGDWECLLVDDGSTDGSSDVCDHYGAADTRFRIFHTANRGVSAARNTGIEHARAPMIAFIDSDDWVEADYLSELYRTIKETGADMSLCGMKKIRPGGTDIISPEAGTVTVDGVDAERFVALNRRHLLYGPVVKLYRADIIRAGGIRFPEGVQFGEDLTFNFEYLEHVRAIAVCGKPLYNYRIAAAGSLSTSGQSRDFDTNYRQWKTIRSFFERRGIGVPQVAEFLSNRLWGLAYDTAMSRRMSMGEIREVFDDSFIGDLHTFDTPSIPIPGWLKTIILKKHLSSIWLIQQTKK